MPIIFEPTPWSHALSGAARTNTTAVCSRNDTRFVLSATTTNGDPTHCKVGTRAQPPAHSHLPIVPLVAKPPLFTIIAARSHRPTSKAQETAATRSTRRAPPLVHLPSRSGPVAVLEGLCWICTRSGLFCAFCYPLSFRSPFFFSFPIRFRPFDRARRLVPHPCHLRVRHRARDRPFSKTSRVRTSSTMPCGLVAGNTYFEFVVYLLPLYLLLSPVAYLCRIYLALHIKSPASGLVENQATEARPLLFFVCFPSRPTVKTINRARCAVKSSSGSEVFSLPHRYLISLAALSTFRQLLVRSHKIRGRGLNSPFILPYIYRSRT
jgi:hypothetical protein